MKKKLYGLEALRGFAAIYVLLHHSHIFPNKGLGFLLYFGQEAVILFFLISGFVINYSISSRVVGVVEYIQLRFRRIFPIFIFSLLLAYLSVSLTAERFLDVNFSSLIGNVLMLQDVSSLKRGVWFDTYMGNAPLWSLSYEWWFYMLFIPLGLGGLSTKMGLRAAAGISIFGWLTYTIFPNQISNFAFYFLIWWAGVEFSREYLREGFVSFNGQKVLLLLMGLMIVLQTISILLFFKDGRQNLKIGIDPILQLRHYLAAVIFLSVAIFWGWYKFSGFMRVFGVFGIFAPISYAIYVVHQPIFNYFSNVDWLENNFQVLLLSFPLILLLAWSLEIKLQGLVNRFILVKKTELKPEFQ